MSARHLAVVGGLDAGRTSDLPDLSTDVAIGRAPDNPVRLDHATVSRRHAWLDLGADDVHLTDGGSLNGTHLNGRRIAARSLLGPGDLIRFGAVAVEIRDGHAPASRDPGRSTTPFNRPPRSAPTTEARIDVPTIGSDGHDGGVGLSMAMLLGPLIFGAVMALLFSPLMAVFALMGPVMMLGSWAERRLRDRRRRRRSDGVRRLTLAAFERQARHHHRADLVARRRRHPDPATMLPWTEGGSQLWQRRPQHDDAFELAVGIAHQRWWPWGDDDERSLPEPVLGVLASIGPLPDAPVVAQLGAGRAIGVVGPRPARQAVIRWLVCQVSTLHGPADVTVRALSGGALGDDWSFLNLLPHGHETRPELDEAEPRRGPLDLVVVPEAATGHLIEALAGLLTTSAGSAGRSAIVGADRCDDLPSWCTTIVELSDDDGTALVRWPESGRSIEHVLATGISDACTRRWASALSCHRDPETGSTTTGLPDRVTTTELLGPVTPSSIVATWHRARQTPGEVRAPLGSTTARGSTQIESFTVDLIADGPHALIGGTTGSGKSELLRTLVLSLALHHGPDTVSFLLIDYKGGSAFDACADLPHTVGVVTDLDEHLASRALIALDAEIHRRERVLRDAGVVDLASGAVPSLARLVVVIDEFATLAAELPGFLDALVDVAQRGRSLGVHLVLATQRPHGAVNDRIRTNTNLRIALRMLDRAESSDVIDDPAAARLPRDRPGRAVARLGPDELIPFQAALTDPDLLRSLVEQITTAATRAGLSRPRSPWLPPLPHVIELADLPTSGDDAEREHEVRDGPESTVGGGAVALALADEPDRQRQRPWSWHPTCGNLVVYGMPGSGTTTALVTAGLVLARQRSPDRCHLHGIADGSGGLDQIAGLPHVGAIVGADEVGRQARLVRMLADELDRRRSKPANPGPAVVVLVDDLPGLLRRFDTLQGHRVIDQFHRVFRDGPQVALHMAVTGDRPGTIPTALASRTTERLVLRLLDPFDLVSLGLRPGRRVGAGESPPPPGRGIIGQTSATEVQVASASRPAAAVDEIVRKWSASGTTHVSGDATTSGGPWSIGELPVHVPTSGLPRASRALTSGDDPRLVLPIGIGDRDLRPRGLELRTGDHALIVGPPRSGRSTALCLLARTVLPARGGPSQSCDSARCGPGVVIALAPRASPLRHHPGVIVVTEVIDLVSAVARAGDADITLVLIDDADLVDDRSGALLALAGSDRPGLHLVASGRTERLRTAYAHWTAALRTSGCGLALRPDVERDGELWGVRLPADAGSRRSHGRGFLLVDGDAELVQLASIGEPSGETAVA